MNSILGSGPEKEKRTRLIPLRTSFEHLLTNIASDRALFGDRHLINGFTALPSLSTPFTASLIAASPSLQHTQLLVEVEMNVSTTGSPGG